MKVCIICKIEKDVKEFYKDKNSKDGLHSRCKLCFYLKIPKIVAKEGFKFCSKCKIEKICSEFYPDKTKKTGFASWCRDCGAKAKQTPEFKARNKERNSTPEAREKKKIWRKSPGGLASMKKHNNSPERKAYIIDYNQKRAGTPEYKEWLFEYRIKQYGLTIEQYNKILLSQNNVCAICKTDRPGGNGNINFHIDHDHRCCPAGPKCCGKCVRGILCSQCNQAIGMLHEDIEILKSAIYYLQKPANNYV